MDRQVSVPEVEEELDPRVQVELEKLNLATDEINRLEATLEEANNIFRNTLSESTAQLHVLSKKLGSCVEKARPYYEATEFARGVQLDCQRAAVQYQRACAVHQAARETIAVAEERFGIASSDKNRQFDAAWQEMLNHATIKVMEAEAQKAASEREHEKRAVVFTEAERCVQDLQRKLRSTIAKSQPYFLQKAAIQAQLEAQKERVHQLQRDIISAKTKYALSLQSLEEISEEIHEHRRCQATREPGVGAEVNSPKLPLSDDEISSATLTDNLRSHCEQSSESLHEKLGMVSVDTLTDKCVSDMNPVVAGRPKPCFSEQVTVDKLSEHTESDVESKSDYNNEVTNCELKSNPSELVREEGEGHSDSSEDGMLAGTETVPLRDTAKHSDDIESGIYEGNNPPLRRNCVFLDVGEVKEEDESEVRIDRKNGSLPMIATVQSVNRNEEENLHGGNFSRTSGHDEAGPSFSGETSDALLHSTSHENTQDRGTSVLLPNQKCKPFSPDYGSRSSENYQDVPTCEGNDVKKFLVMDPVCATVSAETSHGVSMNLQHSGMVMNGTCGPSTCLFSDSVDVPANYPVNEGIKRLSGDNL